MKDILLYLRKTLILELKKTIAYPASFWLVVITIPLYSIIQIIFLETIYSQTNNFAGYTKYGGYVLFGTFTLVQTLGHLLFYNRLAEIKGLIRGGAQESFDTALTKPIDAQIFTTIGRFSFGNIAPMIIAIVLVFYGLFHEPHLLNIFNITSYLVLVVMGTVIFYLTFLFLSTFLFWFPDLQMTEALWESFSTFGKYPSSLYQGTTGILFNLIIPITLMAGIPSQILLGKAPLSQLFLYSVIVFILFVLTRLFWNMSIKQYVSFSS